MVASWLLIPAALPAFYLAYLDYTLSTRLTRTTTSRPTKAITRSLRPGDITPSDLPRSLPAHIASPDAQSTWILTRERITSKPIPASALLPKYRSGGPRKRSSSLSSSASSVLMERIAGDRGDTKMIIGYARAVHRAFCRLPQAQIMRAILEEPRRATLEAAVVAKLRMKPEDLVSGIYRVAYRDAQRVEYIMEDPEVFKGMPLVRGLVVTAVEIREGRMGGRRADGDAMVIFINETWMWRKPHERLTLIETFIGGWLHRLSVSWRVMKGVEALISPKLIV